jgi:hypothetical protein
MRRLIAPLVLLLALVAVPSAASANTHRDTAAKTKVVTITPVSATGVRKPDYTVVAHRAKGQCEAGSDTIPGAYRCFTGNLVVDPCWPVATKQGSVLCTYAPWSKQLFEIIRPGTLGPTPKTLPAAALGMQLADGTRCEIVDGAGTTYRGHPIRYACNGGNSGLVGQPARTSGLWTILRVHYVTKQNAFVSQGTARVAIFYQGRAIHWK